MDKHKAAQGFWLNGLVVALFFILTINPVVAAQKDWIYIVAPGDTLWDLSKKYFPRVSYWKKFQQLNGIDYPKRIEPGTRLRVPLAWLSDQAVPANVAAVHGEAVLIPSATKNQQQLVVNTKLHLGDQVRTGPSASASIEFADGSILTIHQETSVLFDHLSAYSDTGMVDTRLRLEEGRLDIRAQPSAGPGSRFEIQTPAAVSAVRGTKFRAAAEEQESATWVEVIEGKVASTGDAKTALVSANFGTKVIKGQPPLPPKPLLKPPVFKPLPEKIERINWPLIWEPLPGAGNYRIEVSAGDDFHLILWERSTENPRTSLPDLADGSYYVRVRGIDNLGIEGLNRVEKIELDARPQPPVALEPNDGAVIRGEAPPIRWTDSTEAVSYRLQVTADGTDFTNLLVDQNEYSSTSYVPSLDLGVYQWRLASISDSGEQGPFSPIRTFEIKPVPDKPLPELTSDEDKIVASWQPGVEGQTYRVQLAKNRKFTDIILDEPLTEPQIEIPQLKGQYRYMRVCIVEPDGYEGPWGAVQEIAPLPDYGWIPVVGFFILGILIL